MSDVDPSTQGLTASRIELFSNFLERASALMAHATSYQETLERMGDLVVPLFADWCSIDLLESDGRWHRRLLRQDNPEKTALQEVLFREYAPETGGRDPIMGAVVTGRAELWPVIDAEWIKHRARDDRHAALLREAEIHSALFLPLFTQDRLRGVLSMYASDPSRPSYDGDDLRFAELLATVVAAALRNVDYLTSAAAELAERRRVEGELRQSLEREAARLGELRAIMDAVPAAVWIANDADCHHVEGNAAARRLTRTPAAGETAHIAPPMEWPSHFATFSKGLPVAASDLPLQRAARLGQVVRDEELEFVFADGSRVYTTISSVPLFDDQGAPRGAVAASLDITRLKLTEAELLRHHENLERMVQERTRALEESHARLRDSERMALIGTLSAGLGHDMGNLLLPLRLRLDALNEMNLPEAAKADLEGIATALRYLQRLTSGLRLLARDPEGRAADLEATVLGPWWDEVRALMKDALAPGIELVAEFEENLPAVAVPQAALTQIVLNLIQNAGHALRGRVDGLVRVSASAIPADRAILIRVRDNGPGMDEETRRRCFEPFYSTKRRQLSTGLGLAVVRGLVDRAGGTITVDSTPGEGAQFNLTFRAAAVRVQPTTALRVAFVTVRDPRARALVTSVLSHADFDVCSEAPEAEGTGSVWITDQEGFPDRSALEAFVVRSPVRLVVLLGSAGENEHPQIRALESVARIGALRSMLDERDALERATNLQPSRTRAIA